MGNLFDSLQDIGNYEKRKLEKTILKNGLKVSTAFTSDCGWETAILDGGEVHPVERYDTKDEAKQGHDKWVKVISKSPEKITKLGYPGLVEEEEVIKLDYKTNQ